MDENLLVAGRFVLLAGSCAAAGAIVGLLFGRKVILQLVANIALGVATCVFLEWFSGNLPWWPRYTAYDLVE